MVKTLTCDCFDRACQNWHGQRRGFGRDKQRPFWASCCGNDRIPPRGSGQVQILHEWDGGRHGEGVPPTLPQIAHQIYHSPILWETLSQQFSTALMKIFKCGAANLLQWKAAKPNFAASPWRTHPWCSKGSSPSQLLYLCFLSHAFSLTIVSDYLAPLPLLNLLWLLPNCYLALLPPPCSQHWGSARQSSFQEWVGRKYQKSLVLTMIQVISSSLTCLHCFSFVLWSDTSKYARKSVFRGNRY